MLAPAGLSLDHLIALVAMVTLVLSLAVAAINWDAVE